MKDAVPILVGALLAAAFLWASVTLWGYLHVWLWPNAWWKHHLRLWTLGLEVLALLPFVVALALVFARLFRARPVFSASISMAISLLLALVPTLIQSPELVGPLIRLGWTYFVPFALLPPLILLLMPWMRSNNRWRGP